MIHEFFSGKQISRAKRIIVQSIAVLLFVSSITLIHTVVLAQSASTSSANIQQLQETINKLQNEENTLSKQISLVDSQIGVTQLRVDSIQTALVKLSSEIDQLVGEIDRLEGILTRRSELVLRRIPEAYKRSQVPQFASLFLSKDFPELLRRAKYIETVQSDDAQLMFQLKATQNNFAERRNLRETKKIQQEELKIQLEKESKELNVQKKQKQELLEQTKSSEAVYQRLLAQALAERQALEKALIEGVKVGPVKKGDPIALVGNSGYPGCSSGAHLHYEVRKSGTWINAQDFLPPKDVSDHQAGGAQKIGNGSYPGYDWPLEGDIIVTQHYGKTPYSWRYAYSGGIHTGVDMYSLSSSVIRAPNDGTLFSSSQSCGSSSVIKIKYIEHNDGNVTFYLHVQ